MKEKTKPDFKKNLLISYLIGIGVLAVMAVLLLWKSGWAMYAWATFFSDTFALGGMCYVFVFVICLLSRTTFFARFGYRAQKREAKRNKTMPKYRTIQAYLEARPEPAFKASLLLIPGLTYFAIALILLIFVYLV